MNNNTIEIAEVRRVLKRIMLHSENRLGHYRERAEMHKDEDPVTIAQWHVKIVEHSTEWNTAFFIANELKIKLDEEATSR